MNSSVDKGKVFSFCLRNHLLDFFLQKYGREVTFYCPLLFNEAYEVMKRF